MKYKIKAFIRWACGDKTKPGGITPAEWIWLPFQAIILAALLWCIVTIKKFPIPIILAGFGTLVFLVNRMD